VTSRGAAPGLPLSDHPCAGPEELERCLFAETLALVATGGQPQGHLWVRARHAPYEQEGQRVRSCLLLQAGSQGLLDGVPYSCSLTGELGALEWDVAIPQTGMSNWDASSRVSHGVSPQADPQHQAFSYSWASLEGLLGEAASLLLLRVLACRRAVPPSITFPAIDKEGHLCTTTYVRPWAPGVGWIWVLAPGWRNSALMPFCRHLARRVQVGCPVVAVLQDAPALSGMGAEPQPLFPKQLLDWEEDAQLCSWFLDRKEELRASHSTYIQQHPELFALLADFLQALLLRQPPDPILFAAEFFAPFARHQPPGPSFASSISPSPFCSISCMGRAGRLSCL
uniref:Ciliogenesis-associated TTC17-interacting protein n=1 Tax=Phasianus colchicus TaxID=9054 RepID=A0A669PGR5_PHACC